MSIIARIKGYLSVLCGQSQCTDEYGASLFTCPQASSSAAVANASGSHVMQNLFFEENETSITAISYGKN